MVEYVFYLVVFVCIDYLMIFCYDDMWWFIMILVYVVILEIEWSIVESVFVERDVVKYVFCLCCLGKYVMFV